MGRVLNLSGPAMDMMMYGERSPFLSNYLSEQIHHLTNMPILNQFGTRILNAVTNSYNFITDQMTQLGFKRELENLNVGILDNYFTNLTTWEQLQQANTTMQRWVMANPKLKELYVKQNIDGYGEEYRDITDGAIGEDDYNYRRVMSGVIQDVGEDEYKIVHYYEDLLPGDRELTHYEKDIVLNTWSTVDWILENCEFDFTCKSDVPVKINR